MTTQQILFYVMATLAVGSAVTVVAARHPLHGAFALIATLFFLAGIFVQLDAHFVAAIQVLVYAGAVMVLFTFVIMLLNFTKEEIGPAKITGSKVLGVALVGTTAWIVASAFMGESAPAKTFAKIDENTFGTIEHVGKLLFTKYLFPFEVISILLLAAVLGAVVLAKKKLD
jgi:NADH-quinone oxidoreductase subunit J